MSYLYILLACLMWSVVGIFVKICTAYVSPEIVTMSRFVFGVAALAVLMLFMRDDKKFIWKNKWIWIGAIGKLLNYVLENTAINRGFAYGGVVVWPMITLVTATASFVIYKEKITPKKAAAIALCIVGVATISWNGLALDAFLSQDFTNYVLFLFAGVGAAVFVIAQKQLINEGGPVSVNFSMFAVSSVLTFATFPGKQLIISTPPVHVVLMLVSLGMITGISFYFNIRAIAKIPLVIVSVISNASLILSLVWAKVFLDEPITPYIVVGCFIFLAAVLLINARDTKAKPREVS